MAGLQKKLQSRLTELLDTLTLTDSLVNGHIASFFTSNLWSNTLPHAVIQELENFSSLWNFFPLYFQYLSGMSPFQFAPNLEQFLDKAANASIYRDLSLLTPLNQLQAKLNNLEAKIGNPPVLKDFMSEKKKHEVERIVPLAGALSDLTNATNAVDIGGGKGYLSSTLAKHCGIRVLALDSSVVTVHGAEKLERKMTKVASQNDKDLHKFQRETIIVSRQTDFTPILYRNFGQTSKVGLVGLHTCGDLATTCLHHFLKESFCWILNVGCCYHLIEEEFEQVEFWKGLNTTADYGFPVSSFLRQKTVTLGRNARMLAAHSLEKMLESGVSEESARSLYFRALLQVIVERVRGHGVVEGQVGKLARKCVDFNQYIRRAVQKLQLNITLSDADIDSLMADYATEEVKLRVYFLLRIHHAPLVESIILLDRLLFLLEQAYSQYHIIINLCTYKRDNSHHRNIPSELGVEPPTFHNTNNRVNTPPRSKRIGFGHEQMLRADYACTRHEVEALIPTNTLAKKISLSCLTLENGNAHERMHISGRRGIENAYLVPLFDPTLSPRNHAIIAWKNNASVS